MNKTFVLDTNVLLHDPDSLFRFADNNVVIPISVIEEVDRFKKELTEVGRNARAMSRHLDRFREEQGHLIDGVPTPGGGTLRIHLGVTAPGDFPFLENPRTADMRILALAWELSRTHPPVVFITKDTNLRIKADAIGVKAEDYRESTGAINPDALTYQEVGIAREPLDRLFAERALAVADSGIADPGPNALLMLRDSGDPQHSALARRKPREAVLVPIAQPKAVSGIKARNVEQKFALDLLLDREVSLVCLVGKAGTGKTLLALAAGLLQTVEKPSYRRLVVARPIYPMGRDLGYLPGDMDEKLRPWMQPIFDNLEFLLGEFGSAGPDGHPIEQLMDRGLLEIEALTYIRGRSLPRQFMIVDEAQNLTPHEVKTVITRAGEDTKVVLTGDPDQIDNPYVDAASNGLSYAAQRLRGEALAGTVFLSRGERSALAEMAADRL
ncbi:MAG: PhoH family protein [Acidobacteria bacterium]|nr:PhoH family protein [Acidobacteriota bacterium]